MQAAYLRTEDRLRRPITTRDGAGVTPAARPADYVPGNYSGHAGPNWAVIVGLVAGHVAVFAALMSAGVVVIPKIARPPIVVDLIPLPPTPPPPSAPDPRPVVDIVRPVAPVVPPPIVQVAAPPPPTIQTVISAPPPEPAPVALTRADATVPSPTLPSTALNALPGNPPLKYPLDARRKRQEGVVRLRIVIDAEGRVAEISVAQSSGVASLDEAALRGIRKWRFQPKVDAGQPVMAVGYFTQPFALAR